MKSLAVSPQKTIDKKYKRRDGIGHSRNRNRHHAQSFVNLQSQHSHVPPCYCKTCKQATRDADKRRVEIAKELELPGCVD